MAGQESTASQAKSGGSREGHASVSLGSAGAGEEQSRTYLKEIFRLSEALGSRRLSR
jgi:hypothetical protein